MLPMFNNTLIAALMSGIYTFLEMWICWKVYKHLLYRFAVSNGHCPTGFLLEHSNLSSLESRRVSARLISLSTIMLIFLRHPSSIDLLLLIVAEIESHWHWSYIIVAYKSSWTCSFPESQHARWNSLPADIVTSNSIVSFKDALCMPFILFFDLSMS